MAKIIVCTECGGIKPLSARGLCNACYLRHWRQKHPNYHRRYYQLVFLEKKICENCGEEYEPDRFNYRRRKYCSLKCWRRARHWRLKLEMIKAYGGECVCCGERTPEFLSIHHIGGGGKEDRARLGGVGLFYQRLKQQGWPKDNLHLLCFNCNSAIGFYGYCPHKTERR